MVGNLSTWIIILDWAGTPSFINSWNHLQLWPLGSVRSSKKNPFTECIIPFKASFRYNWGIAITVHLIRYSSQHPWCIVGLHNHLTVSRQGQVMSVLQADDGEIFLGTRETGRLGGLSHVHNLCFIIILCILYIYTYDMYIHTCWVRYIMIYPRLYCKSDKYGKSTFK